MHQICFFFGRASPGPAGKKTDSIVMPMYVMGKEDGKGTRGRGMEKERDGTRGMEIVSV